MSYLDADGMLVKPPFPILTWIVNSLQGLGHLGDGVSACCRSRAPTRSARLRFRGPRAACCARWPPPGRCFPAVLALVAYYSIFDPHRRTWCPWLGLDSHWKRGAWSTPAFLSQYIWLIKGYYDQRPRREIGGGRAGRGRCHAVPRAFVHVLFAHGPCPSWAVVFRAWPSSTA